MMNSSILGQLCAWGGVHLLQNIWLHLHPLKSVISLAPQW